MIGPRDLGVVVVVVLAVAVIGTGAGALLVRLLRKRTIWASVGVVIATATVVMAAGVLTLGKLMLVSEDALGVLVAAVVVSALAAGLVAAALARRLAQGSSALAAAARRLGAGEPLDDVGEPDTRELRELGTALRAAADRLAEARRRARTEEAARTELIAWVSHDLRSPVAGIRAMAEALEDGVVADAPSAADYHRRIRRESVRLARMIEDLFELSGIHAGALVVRPRKVALQEVVDEVVQAAEPIAAAGGVRLVTCVPRTPVVALADPDQLSRAVRNLVDNGVRHTASGGVVTVRAEAGARPGDAAAIAVEDGCGGIPESERERVFEVGYRGEWARTPGEDVGAGLGLAIAHGIVSAHRGRIEVSDVAGGCRFTVTLPTTLTPSPTADRVGAAPDR
ncbi:MAG TPA: HAMP domain-containing sensor histidine kinase [Actinotalea sp.]|nr:HAMP domain-containing sensor histidine kinase [Actinotalea sp.]